MILWAGGGDAPAQRTQPISLSTPASSLFPLAVTKANSHPCYRVPEVWDETSQNPFLLFPSGGPSVRATPPPLPGFVVPSPFGQPFDPTFCISTMLIILWSSRFPTQGLGFLQEAAVKSDHQQARSQTGSWACCSSLVSDTCKVKEASPVPGVATDPQHGSTALAPRMESSSGT